MGEKVICGGRDLEFPGKFQDYLLIDYSLFKIEIETELYGTLESSRNKFAISTRIHQVFSANVPLLTAAEFA